MTDADRIRKMLAALGLSQRGAARALDLDERQLRRYCTGDAPVPQTVWLALEALRRDQVVVRVRIPEDLRFAHLRLARDTATGDVTYDARVLRRIAEATGLSPDWLAGEDAASSLIVAWYSAARASGEPPDQVQEDLLREIAAEDARGGGLSHAPGRA